MNNPENKASDPNTAEEMISYIMNSYQICPDYTKKVYIIINGHAISIDSDEFKDHLRVHFMEKYQEIIKEYEMKKMITSLQAYGRIRGKKHKIYTRIAKMGKVIEYDLCRNKKYVRIESGTCSIVSTSSAIFSRPVGILPQVIPNLTVKATALPDLIKKYFRLQDEQEYLLLACYLLACFIPNIQHPLIMFHGNKGAAKTTTLKLITRIVDPRKTSISTLPKSRDDLALILGQNYLSAFDNLRHLSKDHSDLLCINCTGGSNIRRKLYSDSDLVSIKLSSIVALNGIEIVGTQPDLLDRSIIFKLEKVQNTERKSENEFMAEFKRDLPDILGAIFNVLSLSMGRVAKVKLNTLPRMADFARYGYVFAKVLGSSGQDFMKAYYRNLAYIQRLIAETEPTIAAILAFMGKRAVYKAEPAKLYDALTKVAQNEHIDISRNFPRSASALSRKLEEVKDDLNKVNIFFEMGYTHKARSIFLENRNLQKNADGTDGKI